MHALRSSTLVPRGLAVESAVLEEDGEAVIVVRERLSGMRRQLGSCS